MSYHGINSEPELGLMGIVLTDYKEATQDVIPLLDHEKESTRLAAIATCAALNITEALPALQAKAGHLTKEWVAYESGQSEKRFYEIEAVYQEMAAAHFALALWEEDVTFPLMMVIPTTYGTGVIGLLGCCLPAFGQAEYQRDEAKSFLTLAQEIMHFEFLADLSLWRGFMTVPHFWHRLVAQDLAQVTWLDEQDKQALLASLTLMEVQFYEEIPTLKPPAGLPSMNEAIKQCTKLLGLSEENKALFEHIVLVLERLEQAMEARLRAYSFIKPDQAARPASFQELFFEEEEEPTATWQFIQAYAQEVANAYFHALTSDSFSFYEQPEQTQLAFLLLLSGEEIFKELANFVSSDEPDAAFFAELRNFGRDILIYEAIHLWGICMIQLFPKAYEDEALGIAYLARWGKQVLGLSTWLHVPRIENGSGKNGRFHKENPLGAVFAPFQTE